MSNDDFFLEQLDEWERKYINHPAIFEAAKFKAERDEKEAELVKLCKEAIKCIEDLSSYDRDFEEVHWELIRDKFLNRINKK